MTASLARAGMGGGRRQRAVKRISASGRWAKVVPDREPVRPPPSRGDIGRPGPAAHRLAERYPGNCLNLRLCRAGWGPRPSSLIRRQDDDNQARWWLAGTIPRAGDGRGRGTGSLGASLTLLPAKGENRGARVRSPRGVERQGFSRQLSSWTVDGRPLPPEAWPKTCKHLAKRPSAAVAGTGKGRTHDHSVLCRGRRAPTPHGAVCGNPGREVGHGAHSRNGRERGQETRGRDERDGSGGVDARGQRRMGKRRCGATRVDGHPGARR